MPKNVDFMGLAALGAGGRRFESFCPDLKIKELQKCVTPFFMQKPKICTQFALKFYFCVFLFDIKDSVFDISKPIPDRTNGKQDLQQ